MTWWQVVILIVGVAFSVFLILQAIRGDRPEADEIDEGLRDPWDWPW